MEMLREFKVTFYMDTNKNTRQKKFDLDDYESISDLLEAVSEFVKELQNEEGLDSASWSYES